MIESRLEFINQLWDNNIIPTLCNYISIPNKSPQFEPDWKKLGYMNQAASLLVSWCKELNLKNMQLSVLQIENRTPLIFIEIAGASDDTILLYGHFDKQPEMTGWKEGLGPWQPAIFGDKLYGRGAADDGYAIFTALTAIKALQVQNIPHGRCIILIEGCEESGSPDLPFYMQQLQDKIGTPSLIIALDSGCGNYDQLWTTTSLRGLTGGYLTIEVLKEGIHSGTGSGIVPSCFRILRTLLDRIEDANTGNILLEELHVAIPDIRIQQANHCASILGKSIYEELPFLPNVTPDVTSLSELILRRTWKPALSIIGSEGLPAIKQAGNVVLPKLTFKLSMRLPPTCDAKQAAMHLKNCLEKNPPHYAHVHFEILEAESGWNAPEEKPWFKQTINEASVQYFGKEAAHHGEGGSIPFMGMLGKKFPQAQFLITGALGPHANAHGPNEFLHIPTAKKLTACVAQIIEKHFYNQLDYTLIN